MIFNEICVLYLHSDIHRFFRIFLFYVVLLLIFNYPLPPIGTGQYLLRTIQGQMKWMTVGQTRSLCYVNLQMGREPTCPETQLRQAPPQRVCNIIYPYLASRLPSLTTPPSCGTPSVFTINIFMAVV